MIVQKTMANILYDNKYLCFCFFFTCKKFRIEYIKCIVNESLISSDFRISFDRLNHYFSLIDGFVGKENDGEEI